MNIIIVDVVENSTPTLTAPGMTPDHYGKLP